MHRYANRGGNSGVAEYQIDRESIVVGFRDGSAYRYTYASTGRDEIERMKEQAQLGEGLNAFINRVVRKRYERKLR